MFSFNRKTKQSKTCEHPYIARIYSLGKSTLKGTAFICEDCGYEGIEAKDERFNKVKSVEYRYV